MLEAEWAFTNGIEDVCSVVEEVVKAAITGSKAEIQALWKGGDEMRQKSLEEAASVTQWPRMTYTEAITELEKQHPRQAFEFEPKWGRALQSEHERWLAEHLIKGPLFVTDYPAELKPFYMRANDDGKTVACFDLLAPHVGELAGGSLREERHDLLQSNLAKYHLSRDEYRWYLDLRKFGGAPHGGFGMGFERLVGWLGGIDNVRECIAMPRWAGRMLC
jgi:asparaginyl-tRNA synthetase